MQSDRMRRYVRALAPALIALVLAFHFSMTLAYLIPFSPLKLATYGTVRRYIEPAFTQSWELFAPDPKSNPRILMVSCRMADDSGAMTDSPWLDATTRLRQDHYAHRIGFAERIVRAQNAGFLILSPPKTQVMIEMEKEAAKEPDGPLAKSLAEAHAGEVALGHRVFARVASVECDRVYGSDRASEVNIRVVTIPPPPYSKRNDPNAKSEISYFDLGWLPYEHVSPYF